MRNSGQRAGEEQHLSSPTHHFYSLWPSSLQSQLKTGGGAMHLQRDTCMCTHIDFSPCYENLVFRFLGHQRPKSGSEWLKCLSFTSGFGASSFFTLLVSRWDSPGKEKSASPRIFWAHTSWRGSIAEQLDRTQLPGLDLSPLEYGQCPTAFKSSWALHDFINEFLFTHTGL